MNTTIKNVEKVEVNRFHLNVSFSPTKRRIHTKKKEVSLRKFLLQKIHRQKKQQVVEFFTGLRVLWSFAEPADEFQALKLYIHTVIFQTDTFEFNCFGFNFKPNKTGTLFDYTEEDTWRSSLEDSYTRWTRDGRLLYIVKFHRQNRNRVWVTFWDVINFRASKDVFVIDLLNSQGDMSCNGYDDRRINLYLQIKALISLKNAFIVRNPQSQIVGFLEKF